jgi:hypothetical protein
MITPDEPEDLFNYMARRLAAEAAKKAAIEQVWKNANQRWIAFMVVIVHEICLHMERFTADDAYDLYCLNNDPDKPTTHEPRAMGAVMQICAKLGYCYKAGGATLPSRRKSTHTSPRYVWISKLYRKN